MFFVISSLRSVCRWWKIVFWIVVCVEEVYEGVSWAETEPGTNATNPYACGQLAQGAYYRYCHENSTWDDTIIVDCGIRLSK